MHTAEKVQVVSVLEWCRRIDNDNCNCYYEKKTFFSRPSKIQAKIISVLNLCTELFIKKGLGEKFRKRSPVI